jgi:hypothetical protein
MHQRWVLSLFKNGEDAVNAKHEHERGEPSCWVVSRIYREGICDITGEGIGYGLECCFKHLSILSLCVFFSLSFYALSCVLRFSLLIALWGLFSFVVFSEGWSLRSTQAAQFLFDLRDAGDAGALGFLGGEATALDFRLRIFTDKRGVKLQVNM